VLIWTAVMAIVLSIARAVGYWSAATYAWEQAKAELTRKGISVVLLPTPTAAFFSAAVILIAIWASLGAGRARFRYSGFVVFVSAIAISHALSDYHQKPWVRSWGWAWMDPLWFDLQGFLYDEQPLLAWYALTGGMLFAALLMFRSLGYRLCRANRQFAAVTPRSSRPALASTHEKTAS